MLPTPVMLKVVPAISVWVRQGKGLRTHARHDAHLIVGLDAASGAIEAPGGT